MIELYKDEREQILKLAYQIMDKYKHRTANSANLEELAKEAQGRFAELGFIVNVDVTPALVGIGPPDIAVVGRVNPQEPDHERIAKEVRQQYKDEGRL